MAFKDKRVSAGLTQAEAAERLGIARSTVAMWESSPVLPAAGKLPSIAALYGCTIEELLEDKEPKRNNPA